MYLASIHFLIMKTMMTMKTNDTMIQISFRYHLVIHLMMTMRIIYLMQILQTMYFMNTSDISARIYPY